MRLERAQTRRSETLGNPLVGVMGGNRKTADNAPCDRCVAQRIAPWALMLIGHGMSPFALRAAASVWVAREQCVFTLPSEHPMASAVSAIFISSQ